MRKINTIIRKIVRNTKQNQNRNEYSENNISIEKLKELAQNGAIIIDVRSHLEYKEGHIKGAISIPEYEIRKRIKNEVPDNNQKIIVYCGTGHRSKRVQKQLYKMQYNKVYNLENGWKNY